MWTRSACVLLACSTGYPDDTYKVLYVNGSSRTVHGLPNTPKVVTGCFSFQASVLHDLMIEFYSEVLHVSIYLIICRIHTEN